MTRKDAMSLGIKLVGVYCIMQLAPALIYTLRYVEMIRASYRMWMKVATVLLMITSPALWLGFCALMIRSSDRIAGWIYPHDSDALPIMSLGFRDLQLLGFVLIGATALVQSFPQVVSLVVSIWMVRWRVQPSHAVEEFHMSTLPILLAFATQSVLGMILFFRPDRIARIWDARGSR